MGTVEQDVAKIRNAIYGKDVREAIADGIENCYANTTIKGQIDAIEQAGEETIAHVQQAIADSQTAVNQLDGQKDTIAEAVASMASLGTDTTLSTSGMAADAKATGDVVNDLKSAINSLVAVNLLQTITSYTENKYLAYDDGKMYNSQICNVSDYIDLTGIDKIVYTQLYLTSSGTTAGIAFYDSEKAYISGIRCKRSGPSNQYTQAEADVPENAVYMRIPVLKTGDAYVYSYNDYISKVSTRLETTENNVAELGSSLSDTNTTIDDISANGYIHLIGKWAVNGWLSYTGKDSRSYRVRWTDPLTFDRDVAIIAEPGFYISGYKSDGAGIAENPVVYVSANTTIKIYIRRINENTSETADAEAWGAKVAISTAVSPIMADALTYTDVSMFERIGISGDSYAAGGGIISGVTALTWGKNLERQAGITVDIYARSGESIVGWNTDDQKGLPALLAGDECGLYWFQHGINGTSTPEAIGTTADMSANPKPNTFYGQYTYAIEQVKTAFPNARIIMATITGSRYALAQTTYAVVNQAIRDIADYCGVMLVDVSQDDFYKSQWYEKWIRSNHPTAMQTPGMAAANRRLIAKCIMDNPSYFINVGNRYDPVS